MGVPSVGALGAVVTALALVVMVVIEPTQRRAQQLTARELDLERRERELAKAHDALRTAQAASHTAGSCPPTRTPPRDATCLRLSDGSEHCKYNGVCYDGRSLILRNATGTLDLTRKRVWTDFRYFEPIHPLPPASTQTTPWNLQAIPMRAVSAEAWGVMAHGGGFAANTTGGNGTRGSVPRRVALLDACYVVLHDPPFPQGNNLFFFLRSVAMLLDASFHNATYGGWFPPMTNVVLNDARSKEWPWDHNALRSMVPRSAQIAYMGELSESGTFVCCETAVVPGYRDQIFQGPADAKRWQSSLYKALGIVPRSSPLSERHFPVQILLVQRRFTRTFVQPSAREMQQFLMDGRLNRDAHGHRVQAINVTVIDDFDEHSTFEEQVGTFAKADVLVIAHGAAATNIVFAAPHTALVEVFPYKYYKETYRNIAVASGHSYHSIMAQPLPLERYGMNWTEKQACDQWHAIDIMNEPHCHHNYFKHSPLQVDLGDLERVVALAVESVPMNKAFSQRNYTHPITPKAASPE